MGDNIRGRIVAGVLVLAALGGCTPERTEAAAAPVGPTCPSAPEPAGLVIVRADRPLHVASGLDRCDRLAADGPWTVVLRAPDGSLGRHGAVVTFPVDAPRLGQPVAVGQVRGLIADRAVTWPVAGGHARIRGDLGQAGLLAVAARVTVVDGRPAVDPPAGLTVAADGPYRPPTVHELRYGATEVGEQAALGAGLVYTGVSGSGGFEDRLYAVDSTEGPPLRGRPTVVSTVSGGNGTLAWEPAPGVVAYVGYSGALLGADAVAALHRLAVRSRPLSDVEWRAAGPQTVDQTNEPG
ncbi:hypothetical protein [Asanoa sp. NPDC050611]|uniref:hypothetical protein n=1 Tax=Asanoa sp. NPDC050611 TaxID=3157098 RepID=UPI0033E37D5F